MKAALRILHFVLFIDRKLLWPDLKLLMLFVLRENHPLLVFQVY